MSHPTPEATLLARTILALNRPVESHLAPARAVDMLRQRSLGVWYDSAHGIRIDEALALRAIDDAARFCWLVRGAACSDGLSYAANPAVAVAEAQAAVAHGVPAAPDTRSLTRALRRREIRFRLVAADFEGMPGHYAILGRFGLPGWAAAWLMPITPDLGAALHSAHRRTLREWCEGMAGPDG